MGMAGRKARTSHGEGITCTNGGEGRRGGGRKGTERTRLDVRSAGNKDNSMQ